MKSREFLPQNCPINVRKLHVTQCIMPSISFSLSLSLSDTERVLSCRGIKGAQDSGLTQEMEHYMNEIMQSIFAHQPVLTPNKIQQLGQQHYVS